MTDKFFEKRQEAAALKHALLKRYLPIFVGKTGSTSGGVVYYIDAFAGPGEYEDGRPGSPQIGLDLHYAMRKHRSFRGICIESDKKHYGELAVRLASTPEWTAVYGTAEGCLPDALRQAQALPVFVFLDPFALKGMPFKIVANTLKRIGKTEVLVRVHTGALVRLAGMVNSTKKTQQDRDAVMAAGDRFLGGDWWRSIPSLGTPDFPEEVLTGYAQRLSDASGHTGYYFFPIEETPDALPKYWLLHMSKHPAALWAMAESLSLSREDRSSQRGLFDDDQWAEQIAKNAREILRDNEYFVPSQNAGELYGETLGHARELHVRKALKQLYKNNEIVTEPKGKLAQLRIRRGTGI